MKFFQTKNIALIGNQNCGKTTFFNSITGKREKTGNFPGVTVKKSSAFIKKNKEYRIFDLPGLYSLSSLSEEEKVTERFLKSDKTDIIFNIVDSTNIRRNLFLTFQLIKFNKPMVIIFNMKDELDRRKLTFDIEKFSKLTGISCIFVSARKKIDISKIISLIKEVQSKSFNTLISYKCENEIYPLVDSLCDACINGEKSFNTTKTDRLIMTGPLAIPVFLSVCAVIFSSSFFLSQKLSDFLTQILYRYIYGFTYSPDTLFASFVREGLIKGVMSVLSFLPVVIFTFFFLSILEDSGYMARVSFITDKIMKKAGLSGKAFFHMFMGFGCSVPAVLATRTLSCSKEKKCAMKLIPFISCSAKLPVYLYITNLFFKEKALIIITALYVLGIILGTLFVSLSTKKQSDFILEIPTLRIPSFNNVFSLIIRQTGDFISKVFGIIIIVSSVIWLLSNFNMQFCAVPKSDSILAFISGKMCFLFAPLGLGKWEIVSSLLCGIGAKEAIISALSVLSEPNLFTPLSSLTFLIFVLLYTPCISTLAVIKKESGSFLFMIKIAILQFFFAWMVSFIFYSFMLPFFV